MENLVYLTVAETDNFIVHVLSPWTADELSVADNKKIIISLGHC